MPVFEAPLIGFVTTLAPDVLYACHCRLRPRVLDGLSAALCCYDGTNDTQSLNLGVWGLLAIAVPAIGLAAAFVAVMLVGMRPSARRRFSAQWIRKQNAPITAELTAEVEDVLWHQLVGGLVGGLAGLIVVLPAYLRFDPTDAQSLTPGLAAWVAPFILIFVGRGVTSLVFAFRDSRGPIRVAKSWAPRLTDYVSRVGLVIMRVEMVVLLTAGLAATQVPSWIGVNFDPGQSVYVWGSVAVVALIWAGVELVAHRLVAQPLPSADAITLFWRDALRGERLRDVCRLPAFLGILAPQVISNALPRFYGAPAGATGSLLVMVFSILILLLALSAQLVLLRPPNSRRGDAVLIAARRVPHDV